jgi:ribonuclease G
MSNTLLINVTPQETRVADIENGVINDYYFERRRNRGVVGNLFKGRVIRVLPGMQAAFVDIGLEKAAFLYVNDVFQGHAPLELEDENRQPDDDDDDDENGNGARRRRRDVPPIEDQLKEGQEILVQVVKDPIGTKGARVTCHISLPGRYLVFMPTVDHVGVSRQIGSEKERRRLRDLANEMRPKGGGFIVRTASTGVPSNFLRHDMKVLISLWNEILTRSEKARPPAMLHEDLDLILRAARDLATADLERIIVDSREEYDRIIEFIQKTVPHLAGRVELFVGRVPIFDAFGIEDELRAAGQRNVALPSGGYLVIEKTEALTSIDINTGRFVGKKTLEDTIVRTNLEACEAIAHQLRIRNIGGLVIIDFIDMEHSDNRQGVYEALEAAFAGDRGRVKFTRISEFGIVELTRKRTRESLEQVLYEACEHCAGSGRVRTRETISYEILRELRRALPLLNEFDVNVYANPRVIAMLQERDRATIRELELRFNKKVYLRSEQNRGVENFELRGVSPSDNARSGGGGSPR